MSEQLTLRQWTAIYNAANDDAETITTRLTDLFNDIWAYPHATQASQDEAERVYAAALERRAAAFEVMAIAWDAMLDLAPIASGVH